MPPALRKQSLSLGFHLIKQKKDGQSLSGGWILFPKANSHFQDFVRPTESFFSLIVRWYYLKSVHPLVWDPYPISYSDSDKKMLLLGVLFKALLIFSGCRHLQKKLVEHPASGIEPSLLTQTISNSLETEHVPYIRLEITFFCVYCRCISCQLVSSANYFISENCNGILRCTEVRQISSY